MNAYPQSMYWLRIRLVLSRAFACVLLASVSASGATARYYQVEVIVVGYDERSAYFSSAVGTRESFSRPVVVIDRGQYGPTDDFSFADAEDNEDGDERGDEERDNVRDAGDGEGAFARGEGADGDSGDDGVNALSPTTSDTPFVEGDIVFQEGEVLSQRLSNLNARPAYRVLRYLSWVQPAATRNSAPQVSLHLREGLRYNLDVDADGFSFGDDYGSHMEGTVHIYTLGPYLQSEVDVQYRSYIRNRGVQPLAEAFRLALDPTPPYHLREQRRIQLEEINYYDHPKFGVLIVVTRSDKPSLE